MKQLNLAILPTIAYRPDQYIAHAGVSGLIRELGSFVKSNEFRLAFVHGSSRYGKTHMAVYLSQLILDQGKFPKILTGQEFSEMLNASKPPSEIRADEVFLIDDVHHYLGTVLPGNSGPFVNFVELVRAAGAKLILFSTPDLADFSFDQHINSRLQAGSGFALGSPHESELPAIIDIMARQRGIKLTEKKQEFLERRLGRDLPAIEEYLERLVHLTNVLGKRVGFEALGDAL